MKVGQCVQHREDVRIYGQWEIYENKPANLKVKMLYLYNIENAFRDRRKRFDRSESGAVNRLSLDIPRFKIF